MMRFRGVPIREVDGLPYTVHQVSDGAWQIVIENCPRYPAGYSFTACYGSEQEAIEALERWPHGPWSGLNSKVAGDDTGASELVQFED